MTMEQKIAKKKVAGSLRLRFPITSPILFCQGCQSPTVGRIVAEVLDEMEIDGDTILHSGIGCHSVISAFLNLDVFLPAAAHGRAPDVATGVKRILGKKAVCLTIQGDGDAISIGTEPLVQAAARSERLTVIMINNQCYGTTGGQLAPTTILGTKTPTTPLGRSKEDGYPIRAAELLAGIDGVVYSARGALNSVKNFRRTKKFVKKAIQKQLDDRGFSFVEILAACPTNWRLSPIDCITFMEENLIPQFPLGEFKDIDDVL